MSFFLQDACLTFSAHHVPAATLRHTTYQQHAHLHYSNIFYDFMFSNFTQSSLSWVWHAKKSKANNIDSGVRTDFLTVHFHLFTSSVGTTRAPRWSLRDFFLLLLFFSFCGYPCTIILLGLLTGRQSQRRLAVIVRTDTILQEYGLMGLWISGKIGYIPTDWSYCITISYNFSFTEELHICVPNSRC
jgi:hypothetical protein